MSLASILITLLIICLVFGLLYWLLSLFPMPQPFKNFALGILILIVIILVIGMFFGGWVVRF